MVSFVIEKAGKIKEAFQYQRPLINGSYKALEEYARATYGTEAIVREMTKDEEARFMLYAESAFGI